MSKKINYSNAEIFNEVYSKNYWGGLKGEFFSGPGSHNDGVIDYVKVVAEFIRAKKISKIVEIGCGDFNVTRQVLDHLNEYKYNFTYVGYDVVKDLTERNKKLFESEFINFICADATIDEISSGDLLIVRQVLQHMNNDCIQKIVSKFNKYNHILVSEHQADRKYGNAFKFNKNKATDASIRILYGSGVYLEYPPFNCNIQATLHSIYEKAYGFDAHINTFHIVNNIV